MRSRILPAPPILTEQKEQESLFNWAASNGSRRPELRLLFAIPNGLRTSIGVALKAKRAGLKAGVPDVFLPVPRGRHHGLFIELKRVKCGRLSPQQKAWLRRLEKHGYKCVVARGFDAARRAIEHYLSR
jgi:VRR-NUC domain